MSIFTKTSSTTFETQFEKDRHYASFQNELLFGFEAFHLMYVIFLASFSPSSNENTLWMSQLIAILSLFPPHRVCI